MKCIAFVALSFLASAASAFHIVPPSSITACEPLTVEYDTRTGQPPFSLSFHNNSSDGPLDAVFTNVTGTSFTWDLVTIPAGTNVVIVLGDANGLGSDTPVITVMAGLNDVCLDNPTSIPSLPSVTSTSPPTSTFDGSSIPSSLLTTTTTTTTTSMSSPTSSSSIPSSVLSSIVSSVSSQISSLDMTSTPKPSATGGLGTSGGVVNSVGFFSIGAITVIMGALLA